MMKRFKEIGKWTGLMLVACSLLFAGCAQDSSSSEEGALGSDSVSSLGVPVEAIVGADGDTVYVEELAFGNGGDSGVGVFGGHTVEVINGDSGCTAGANPACWIKIINRADSHYMANTRIYTDQSGDDTAQFDNADFAADGTNLHSAPPDPDKDTAITGDYGYTEAVEGGGFCVVEDGKYGTGYNDPYNLYGCETRPLTNNQQKPYQMLAPDCGSREIQWDFGNHAAGNFPFFAQIDTEWWPENPHDDARFDFQDRTTLYYMIADLEDTMTATYKEWYRLGSYKRSNVLAGWNQGGNGNAGDSGVTFGATITGPNGNTDAREYFALNVAVEYPDRLESYDVGDKSNFTNYEYYYKFSTVTTWDPDVVEKVSAAGKTRGGKGLGTGLVGGAVQICNDCGKGLETFTGMEGNVSDSTIAAASGYILTYEFRQSSNGFTWMYSGDAYSTVNGDVVYDYYGGNVPGNVGQYGRANVQMTPTHAWTSVYPNTIFYSNSAVNQQPVDEDPDMPLAMYYFKVVGEAGDGTWLRSNMDTANSQPELQWTNGTITGGYGAGSDDTKHDYPFGTGGIINNGLEQTNPNITHSGFAMPGAGGAFQSWNVHVCLQ